MNYFFPLGLFGIVILLLEVFRPKIDCLRDRVKEECDKKNQMIFSGIEWAITLIVVVWVELINIFISVDVFSFHAPYTGFAAIFTISSLVFYILFYNFGKKRFLVLFWALSFLNALFLSATPVLFSWGIHY